MPRDFNERRNWTRLPVCPRRDVTIRSPDHIEHTGRLVEESFGGAGIVLETSEIPHDMVVGELVQVQDQGVWMPAFIRHVRLDSVIGVIVGVEWFRYSKTPSQS